MGGERLDWRSMSALRLLLAVTLVAALAPSAHAADGPGWVPTGPIHTARADAAATRLADGDVLMIGGVAPPPVNSAVSSVERYDHLTQTWSEVAPLPGPRQLAAAVTLGDGRVLVVGGQADYDHRLTTTALYDPAADTWSAGPP